MLHRSCFLLYPHLFSVCVLFLTSFLSALVADGVWNASDRALDVTPHKVTTRRIHRHLATPLHGKEAAQQRNKGAHEPHMHSTCMLLTTAAVLLSQSLC